MSILDLTKSNLRSIWTQLKIDAIDKVIEELKEEIQELREEKRKLKEDLKR
jgi:peptidoglycan hydrolase CwlO-like protein